MDSILDVCKEQLLGWYYGSNWLKCYDKLGFILRVA